MRTKFAHHVLLSAYGGCLIGAVEGHGMAPASAGVLGEFVVMWTPWGLLCGLATWPLIRSRQRWATPAILSAGAIAAGVAALLNAGFAFAMLMPAAAQLAAAVFGYFRWPAEYGPGMCRKCGYFLRGLTTSRCPECGTRFD
jgi:CHASE2 domain-containing sensor protein